MLASLMLVGLPLLMAFAFAVVVNFGLIKVTPSKLGSRLLIVCLTWIALGAGGLVGLILGAQINRYIFDYEVLSKALNGAELFLFSVRGLPTPTVEGAAFLQYTAAGLIVWAIGFSLHSLSPFFNRPVNAEANREQARGENRDTEQHIEQPVFGRLADGNALEQINRNAIEQDFIGDDSHETYVNKRDEAPQESSKELT